MFYHFDIEVFMDGISRNVNELNGNKSIKKRNDIKKREIKEEKKEIL